MIINSILVLTKLVFSFLEMDKNIDQNEVNKFAELADKWWDSSGEFKPLHNINPIRSQYISSKIDLKGKKVLDVGCGGGLLAEAL